MTNNVPIFIIQIFDHYSNNLINILSSEDHPKALKKTARRRRFCLKASHGTAPLSLSLCRAEPGHTDNSLQYKVYDEYPFFLFKYSTINYSNNLINIWSSEARPKALKKTCSQTEILFKNKIKSRHALRRCHFTVTQQSQATLTLHSNTKCMQWAPWSTRFDQNWQKYHLF